MQNPRLAGRYAKSLIDIAVERNELEVVHNDMQYLKAVCKASKDFVALLKSPVIPLDKKSSIVKTITMGKVSTVTMTFNQLLINKNREFYLPEIVDAFIDQYNKIKGIHKIKLTTASPVSEELKKEIVSKVTSQSQFQKVEIESFVREELIGGFILEFDNNLYDASIQRDLREIKTQFEKNVYEQKIR